MIRDTLVVALGGGIGAASRYLLARSLTGAQWVRHLCGGAAESFAIFTVNVSGCFLFGLLFGWAGARSTPQGPSAPALFLLTGILGGYTTFSTFGWHNFEFLREGRPGLAVLNVVASVGAGVLAVWLGWILAGGGAKSNA